MTKVSKIINLLKEDKISEENNQILDGVIDLSTSKAISS